MSSDQILALLVAIVGGVGASLVTGMLSRPKVKAEAGSLHATGETTISGDARAWAAQFAEQAKAAGERAEKSDAKAKAAELRAERAEEKADDVSERLDSLEVKLIAFVNYTTQLQGEIRRLNGYPPSPPAALIPPLVPLHQG